jgi:fatty acid desaturase
MATTTRIEWLTLLLIAAVYATICLVVWFHDVLPWWLILAVGTYAATLHSSLQHEVLHGHPTRVRWLNELLVVVSPTFWMPYGHYRDTHLTHHNDAHLTDPALDPESYYLLPDAWAATGGLKRLLFTVNQTLGGRMLIGPAVSICRTWSSEWAEIFKGNRKTIANWLGFGIAGAAAIYYITIICGMPFWKFYVLIAYPGISMALVRSYCEHQAAEDVGERTIIVEASPFWSLLFLNNNLHIAHHARPSLPWYQLPDFYRAERSNFITRNKNYLMRGYGEVFRRYFFVPKEPIPYPNLRWLKG